MKHHLRILTSWSIRKKLFLLLLFAFVPASGIIVASGFEQRKHEIAMAENNALMVVQSLAAQQEQIAIGTKQMLSTLAQLPVVQRLDAKACSELFRDLNNRHPFYSIIAAATPDGNMFTASTPFKPGSVDLSDRKPFKDAIKTLDFSAGEYIIGRVSKVQSVNYAYPVLDVNKKLIAIVIAGFRLDEYARFMTKVNLPEGSSMTITDHKGVRLYRLPENDATAPGKPISREAFKRISGDLDQGLFERTSEDGIYRIYAFRQLRLRENSSPYLYMMIGIAKDKILHKANLQMLGSLLILGIAAFMAMFLVWVFGNFTLIKPMSHLSTAVQRFGSGEMGARTNLPHTPDELGQLAKSFDDMASLLEMKNIERKDAEGALRMAYDELEIRIQERTVELRQANEAMQVEITERKQAEEALRESEEKYRNILETMTEGYYEIDLAGNYTFVNKAIARFFGLPHDELIGMNNRQYSSPEAAKRMYEMFSEVYRTGIPARGIESEVITKDGSVRTVEMSVSLVRNASGKPIGFRGITIDRTDQKKAEAALRESEEKYRTILEDIEEGYFEVDLAGNFTFINDSVCSHTGYSREELIGMNRRQYVDEKNAKKIFEAFNQIYKTGEPGKVFDYEVIRKDGTKRQVEVSASLRKDSSAKPIGFRGVTRDITERKKAEDALRRSEEEAKRLAQENAIMAEIGRIIGSSLDINEVYGPFAEKVREIIPFDRITIHTINHRDNVMQAAYVTGLDVPSRLKGSIIPLAGTFAEKVIRTRTPMLTMLEDLKKVADTFPNLLSNFQAGIRSLMGIPLISKNEVIGILHIQSTKLDAYAEKDLRLAERVGNQIAGAIVNAQLFAEHKRAEEELRENKERLQTLLDASPVGISWSDMEGNIKYVNRKFRELFGYTTEDIPTVDEWRRLAYPDPDYRETVPLLYDMLREEQKQEKEVLLKELTITCKDGSTRYVEQMGSFAANQIMVIYKDITELKRAEQEKTSLEEQLRQSQKMEAIGKLAGGVAHDFNNLLTVIHGYSELLLHSLDQNSRLRQDVLEIMHASERASSLTHQLLAFSRKQLLQPKVLDLNAHVSNMDKMLHRMIGEDIELVSLLAENLGRIKADPGQIEQVILNLAINAKDAMPNGGKLTIETANVVLDESYARSRIGVTPGRYVMLSMSDTGSGMTPETKERIFDPFFTTKEKGKGTGLGLSTVYGIIQQSGGNIWVYSEPGVGTTFKIYLPTIEEGTESLRPTAVPTKPTQGSETILLVEDEEMVRKLACTVLQKNGYTVLEASNGEEALRIVQGQNGNPIHLMVTDVVMPGMSGRQLAERLLPLRPEMKVLYMSGYTDDAIVHHGVLDPGIAYIQKPFAPDAFASKVREILDGR